MRLSFFFTATSIASRLLVSTLLFLVLARMWGPEQFGTFSFVFSVSALLMLIVDFGFSTYLLREIAAAPHTAAGLIVRGLYAKVVLSGLMMLAAICVALAFGVNALPLPLFGLLLSAALLLSYAEYFIAPLRALGRYDSEAVLAISGNGVQFAFAGLTAWLGGGPALVAAAIVCSRLLYLVFACRCLLRLVPLGPIREQKAAIRTTLRDLWPYGIDGALTSVWNLIDVIAVRLIFGTETVGIYAAGQKVVQGVVALAPLVGNVMIPQLAHRAHTRASDTWRVASITGVLMVAIGVLTALPLIVAPAQLSNALFGPQFGVLAEWLPWFGAILIIRYVGAAFGTVLSGIGMQRKRVVGQVLAVCSYVALVSLVAVCNGGMVAALLSLLVAMMVMGTVYAINLWLAKRRNVLEI